MKIRVSLMVAVLAVGVGCKKKDKAPPPDPTPGSAAMKPNEGSGSGSAAATGPGSQMTSPTDVPLTGEALAKHYIACIERMNAGKLDEYKQHCLHPEVRVHEMDYSEFTGADSVVGYIESMRTAMPDFKHDPQVVLVSGRAIVAINLVTGKHTGPMKMADGTELKGSDKKISILTYDHIRTNEENKATEEWEYMDHHTMLGQLGLAPKEQGPTRPTIEKGWPGAPMILVAKDDAAEKANLELVAKLSQAFNAHKAADVVASFADDVVVSDQGEAADHKGKAAVEKTLNELFAAFPDAKGTDTHHFATGDYVFVEGRLTGTHKGPLGPMKPTNKPIDIAYAEVYKIKNGKVAEMWRFGDRMALTAQLMAKDAPKGAAPKGDAPKGDAPKGDAPKMEKK